MTNNKNPQKCLTPPSFKGECDNEPLDEIMKALEKYNIEKEFVLTMIYGILMKNEKEKVLRKIDQLNSQYPISPFQTNV